MPRLFVAIDLPEDIKDQLIETYHAIPGAKWIDEKQLHLTLRFIGDVQNDIADRIHLSLKSVSSSSFSMALKGVGYFPPKRHPRVLWFGIAENPELLQFQAKIDKVITEAGIAPEGRKYSPHITVARLNKSPLERIVNFISANSLFSTDSFTVTEFHLYSSTLGKEGAHHIKEATYPLRDY
ncbi:RNA 2',3'-cyclic phosphodiesterase [Chitinispirillales bacterium ANBcel5]|uniref:RNA 2',3'-cyclic phosphodiesterase n=1 Tax=Cellulosispirillum alkaliphilum TaxID=3039283 RepID=UPI002A55B4F7|nr:RNA 2',3'-cyclic phosphodiesterase [Chitinispirillales bacterium ANBcel5]